MIILTHHHSSYFLDWGSKERVLGMIQSSSLGYLWRSPSGQLLSPPTTSSPLHHVRGAIKLTITSCWATSLVKSPLLSGINSFGQERWGGIDHSRRIWVQSGNFRDRRPSELGCKQTWSPGWYLYSRSLIFSYLGLNLNILLKFQNKVNISISVGGGQDRER